MEVNDLGIKGMETLPLVLEYLYDVATSLCVCYTSAIRKYLLIITIVYLYFLPVLFSIF